METIETWTYEDFLTYLLLLGAQADLRVSEEEKEEIIRKVGEDQFKKIRRCFDQQNDAQHIDTVIKLYNRFESQIGGKENLVEALKGVIMADTREEQVMDRYLMMMLKKIL